MYRPTLVKHGNISTYAGMRRILKKPQDLLEYYRMAVESGTYRTPEEVDKMLNERRRREYPLRDIMRRFRQDVVRGSYVADYPDEYMIMRQNPPVPDPPRIPKKQQKMFDKELADRKDFVMKRLVDAYLKRQEKDQAAKGHYGLETRFVEPSDEQVNAPTSTQEYYQRLLGVPAPNVFHSNLGKKSAPLQKAYAAAVKHFELVRTNGMTDKEAMTEVDEILKKTSAQEHNRAMETLIKAQKIRQKPNYEMPQEEEEEEDELDDMERIGSKSVQELVAEHQQTKKEPVRKLMSQYRYNEKQLEKDYGKDAIVNPTKDKNTKSESSSHKEEPTTGLESLYDNVLGSNPRVLEAMMRWSVRLKEVPYREWTIGASTALDHWIARQVLQMSEETWATLLEGNDADLLPLGRAIVQTREALFPETLVRPVEDEEDDLLGASADPLGTLDIPQDDPFARNDDEMSLEDLLNSLGDINSSTDSLDALKPSAPEGVNTENGKRLIEELQAYRKKNVETPFDSWQDTDKLQFEDWFQSKFAPVMLPDMTDPTVDWESVKKSLLAAPPVSEKENNEFWSSLQTEQDAIELLEKMRKDGPPPGASILQTAFWDLSYEAQLQQLLNLGAIRPLLDEYADESDRLDFIQRYYDVLMTGVPIEYLVPDDEEGSITVKDMNFETIRSLNIDRNDPRKFKLQVLPYRGALESEKEHTDDGGNVLTTQQLEQSRALYMAWNEHKANRARYEEEMFTSNRLGLRYGDPPEPIFRSPSPERDEKKK